jgi:alanyl-tRNA synthetase
MTIRLYYQDAYLTEFDAQRLRTVPGGKDTSGVILDRTCFYPTSGGQPCDYGFLQGQPVFDVEEQDGEIVHWVKGTVNEPAVRGQIDWSRRFDHMQQHTGQHILSQAFLKLLGAETIGFHLGVESSTIDISRASLSEQHAQAVESLANEIVLSDRPVKTRVVGADQLESLDLRKLPSVDKDIRIVEVEGFDQTPCGGTHCARTGEVGPVAIRRWEHRGGETRVEFLCGWRALRDYHWKTAAINELALSFSVRDTDLPEAVLRLRDESATQRRELARLREEYLNVEAERLLADADDWQGKRIVVRAYRDREPQEIRKLASLLTASPRTVALLGVGGERARLVFARSGDLDIDVAALLKATCLAFGGSGGGQPAMAQGGGFAAEQLEEALQTAHRSLMAH